LKAENVIQDNLPLSTFTRNEGGQRITSMNKGSNKVCPLITVITVVFNGAETIEQTILSVIEQTYNNVEHIVIDGGSSDGTLAILRKYDDKIAYWVSAKDSGIYDAMNKGILLAGGDYIGMLNSDDFFSNPSVLEEVATSLALANVDAVFSCLDIVDPINLDRVLRRYRVKSFSSLMLRIGIMPPHPTFYCKKSCYENAGLYLTNYRIAADFEMLVRLLTKHNITWQFIDKTTIKMRSGGVSNSGIKSKWVINREIVRACNENGLYTNMFLLLFKLPIRLMECRIYFLGVIGAFTLNGSIGYYFKILWRR